MRESYVTVDGHEVKLTNLDKLIWPEGLTKAHLVKYYWEIAPYILPHLYNRPLVMKRYPDGVAGEPFYQKECPDYAPPWIQTHPVEHTEKVVNYIICNDEATLLWLANQACIEIGHPLVNISNGGNLEHPDLAVIDLDPSDNNSFEQVIKLALLVRKSFEEFGIRSYPKTSGARGLHIYVPIKMAYPWKVVTKTMKFIAEIIVRTCPDIATTERRLIDRKGRIYVDYLQNGRGKTMIAPYSVKALPKAPVSTPLHWWEVEKWAFYPSDFNMNTVFSRIQKYGDIFKEALALKQSLGKLVKMLN
jgi:bifunctional non-homologous end joining protein LigD